jgi:hypothetical protein
VLSAAEAFARDQAKFLGLVKEIVRTLRDGSIDHSFFLGIQPLTEEIEILRLAQRFGHPMRPFRCAWHPAPPKEADEQQIFWVDPFGRSGFVVAMSTMSLFNGRRYLSTPRADAAQTILSVAEQWITAIEEARRPQLYPALPGPLPPGVDSMLARDPLWSVLNGAIEHLAQVDMLRDKSWAVGAGPPWRRELEVLVKYEEMADGNIIAVDVQRQGVQRGLIVYHPAGGSTLLLTFQEQGRLNDEQLRDFRSRLTEWREFRALEVHGALPSISTTSGRRPPKRRGPKVKSDVDADRKLYEDYLASGIRKRVEFDRERGLRDGTTEKAYYRLKKRGYHKDVLNDSPSKAPTRRQDPKNSPPRKSSRRKP